MHCTNCATELPPGAMFCGECGRAVTAQARRTATRGAVRRVGELTLEERISSLPEIIFDVPDPHGEGSADAPDLREPEALILPGVAAPPTGTGRSAEPDGDEPAIAEPDSVVDDESNGGRGTRADADDAPAALEGEPEPASEPAPGPGREPEPELQPELQPDPEPSPQAEPDPLPLYVERVWDLDLDPDASPPVLVADAEPTPRPTVAASAEAPAGEVDERCGQCGAPLEARDIFCGECGFVRAVANSPAAASTPARDTAAYDPFPWGLPPGQPLPGEAAAAERFVDDPFVDENDTRIVGPRGEGERFVLQFSTGESISVSGTGLLGRNPHAEPGEYFDAFVPISDPGRSVSKTHLEFGQDNGAFWVSDRFSGNGTVVREPDQAPRRAEPGKRYRVVRGTRIEIGEQFFIVS